ncbi:cytidine deaminase [alpha proteobacterium BAL199]|nr:cytidine deaminase [alpha proteobacterium BAL199]
MTGKVELLLPAVARSAAVTETPLGRLTVPSRAVPERRVMVDPQELVDLRNAARSAADRAHAPYSKFTVGAALIMADDPERRVFTGANVENATYGATICAERTVIAQAAAAGFRRIAILAVSCTKALHARLADRSPCGICRQTIAEFSTDVPPSLVLIDSGDDDVLGDVLDLDRLLPYAFRIAP